MAGERASELAPPGLPETEFLERKEASQQRASTLPRRGNERCEWCLSTGILSGLASKGSSLRRIRRAGLRTGLGVPQGGTDVEHQSVGGETEEGRPLRASLFCYAPDRTRNLGRPTGGG